MVDDGNYDLSANFTLNQLTSDLSANVYIRNVYHEQELLLVASDDLSANFTIGGFDSADLSANFTLNQDTADLSANFKVRNILAYFQHVVTSSDDKHCLTPQPIENYIIRQANRDKIATIDVMYSNSGDRFSWVEPQSIMQIVAGNNIHNKTKVFGGYARDVEYQGENIIFHGVGYGRELLERRITGAFYDIEACDLIKYKLLQETTNIDTSQFSFVGEETTRTSFHSDSYADEANIETKSNITVSGGDVTLTSTAASGYIICEDMTTISELGLSTKAYFDDVKITLTASTPGGSSITIQACNDAGATYESFTDATYGSFTDHHSSTGTGDHGRTFKYKITLIPSGGTGPTLSAISIDVKTKAIKVYERVEFEDETLAAAIKDVLYDASLEGSTDPYGIYRLDYVKDKTTTDFIPYLRQGYEIMKEPVWKKDSTQIITSIKGRGADEGSLTKAEQDQWTERNASGWTVSGDCTISDEWRNAYVKEGGYSIKLLLEGTGFVDDCDDASIDINYYDYWEEGTHGTVIETTYLTIQSQSTDNAAICFDKTTYSLTGDYDISFDAYHEALDPGVYPRYYFHCQFLQEADIPLYKASLSAWNSYNMPRLYSFRSGVGPLMLWNNGSYTTLTGDLEGWFNIRITRSGSTMTIYVDGDQVWSGTFTEPEGTHDNIQFGVCTDSFGHMLTLLDNINWNYVIIGGNVLTPSFNKNLDNSDNLYCWYRQNGSDGFDIRLETDASNYFSRSLTPQKVNEAYELKIPVGSKASGWSSTGSPIWTNITQIRFVYDTGVNMSLVYYDKLYFTVVPIEASYQDDEAIEEYGTRQGKRYVNKQITSVEELEDRLQTIVEIFKNLHEPLELCVLGRRDISMGDLVRVNFPKAGISNVVFRVDAVEYCLGTMTFNRLFCRDIDTVGLVQHLVRLGYETKQIT